jgi:hypothetical protein
MQLSFHKSRNYNRVSSIYPHFFLLCFDSFPLGLRVTGHTDIDADTDTNSDNDGDRKDDQVFRHKENSC